MKKEKIRKGQAAMEYLMTYGWAILVIVIVLAALYFWLPKGSEVCLFREPGFLCEGKPQIYLDSGGDLVVAATIDNKLAETVKADDSCIVCTDAPEGQITASFICNNGNSLEDDLNAGSSMMFGRDGVDPIPCVDRDGDTLHPSENAYFKGYIALAYSLSSDPNPNVKHVTLASVSGPVLSEE